MVEDCQSLWSLGLKMTKRQTVTYLEADIASDMSLVEVTLTELIQDFQCDARDLTPSTMY